MALIDGEHTASALQQDYFGVLDVIDRTGGVILFHDVLSYRLATAFNEVGEHWKTETGGGYGILTRTTSGIGVCWGPAADAALFPILAAFTDDVARINCESELLFL